MNSETDQTTTPAEVLARARWDAELDPDHPWHVAWEDVSPRIRQEQVEFAEGDIAHLAAAGFVVRPLPDEEQRRALLADIAEHLAVEPDWPQMVDQVPVDLLRRAAAFLTE